MKKSAIALLGCLFLLSVYAAKPNRPGYHTIDAKQYFFPLDENGNKLSLFELSHISKQELQQKTGRKMNHLQSISFKVVQKKLNKMIDADGKIAVRLQDPEDDPAVKPGFDGGGFALGFIGGLLGILVAYLIKDEKKKNRVKWAWVGFGIRVIILLALAILWVSGFWGP